MTANEASTVVNGGSMDLDVVTVSEEQGRFMVAFSDASNKGAMTAAVGQVRTELHFQLFDENFD